MKKNILSAFTLVELIVVMTIISILSTLGFVAYTDYLKSVRDSSRMQQMTEIHKALTLYGARLKMPFPEDSISIVSGTSPVGVQGYANQSVLDTIKFSDGGTDPKSNKPYTYFMSYDRKFAQLLGFFEENNSRDILTLSQNLYADETNDYSLLYPYVVGAELGVLIDKNTQIPLQESIEGTFDILSGSDELISYASNSNVTTGSGSKLIGMVPNITCKKILSSSVSANDGIYKININGDKQLDVYCDMTTDGGGWTFVAHVDNDTNGPDIYFNAVTGTYTSTREDTSELYSLNMQDFNHTEMIVTFDDFDINGADAASKFLQFRYNIDTDGFFMGPLMPGCSGTQLLGSAGEFYYKTSIAGDYIYSNISQCNSGLWSLRPTPHNGIYLIYFRDFNSGDGNGTGARYDSQAWGINSLDDGYDVSQGHDVWIYVR